MKRLLYILTMLFTSVSLLAQENRTFKIYDATSMVDNNGKFIQIIDSDNGRSMREMGISLNQLDGEVVVYVTFKRWGELMINSLTNNQNKNEVQSFFNFYDTNDGYTLLPNFSKIYNTQAVRAIGERLKSRFPDAINEWKHKDELFNTDELALIIVKQPYFEELFLLEWIEEFEPNNEISDCPLYYTGKLKIAESEKKLVRKVDFEESSIQVGNEIRFNEIFNISGPSTKRMVVDRFVEICTFDEDYNKLADRVEADSTEQYTLNVKRSKKLVDVLGHMDVNFKQKYRENPYVFPGEKFQRLLRRRMSWDVSRDTLEHYRLLTQKAFSVKNIDNYYHEVNPDTVDFRLDYNLFSRYLSKYKTFWSISPLFGQYLPADGGEIYEDTASVKKYYNLRTDIETYEKLRSYMEKGRRLKGNSQYVVEGFIPSIYSIRAQHQRYSEFWVSDTFYSMLQQSDVYNDLIDEGSVKYVRRENDGNRLRINDEKKHTFRRIFEGMSLGIDSLYLTEKPRIDTTILYWTMPDPDLYYRLKHVNYLHDFMNADTTMTECSCTRTSPLRFLSMSSEPAYPDCPPVINGRFRENYKPVSKTDDPQSVDVEAHLSFDRGSSNIDLTLGNNADELDTLCNIIDEILGNKSFGIHSISHRIDTITILGISSPEGNYSRNIELAHSRSESLINWVKAKCGINHVVTIYKDSVASWDYVGSLVNMSASGAETAFHEGDQAVERAMESLRKVNLRFVYTALMEPSEESVLNIYNEGGTGDIYGAYYYYVLLNSTKLTHEEKLKIAQQVVDHGSNSNFRISRDINRANSEHWYNLIKPLAANYIAADNIRHKKFDASLLAPFIDVRQQGNSASFSNGHLVNDEVPKAYKYVNADFVLYNQIQTLLGIGTTASLQTADSLIQILSVTACSPEFDSKYQPSKLVDLLECFNRQSFLTDQALAERVKETNIINFYVINMAIGHDAYFKSGMYTDPQVIQSFTECYSRLAELDALADERAEKYYYKALSIARYAEMTLSEDKPKQLLEARDALTDMFMANEAMIGICQGDRYIREIYRTPALRQKEIDIYLEAVEEYIKRWSAANE